MEIKFRFKGKARCAEVEQGNIPQQVPIQKEAQEAQEKPRRIWLSEVQTRKPEGIDLTGYPVIYVGMGNSGLRQCLARVKKIILEQNLQNNPNIVFVYEYDDTRLEHGSGVIVSEKFDASRVKFYWTEWQEAAKREEFLLGAAERLCETVKNIFPDVRVDIYNLYRCDGTVRVIPEQETFSFSFEWTVIASTLEEVRNGISQKSTFWKEWNERALLSLKRHGLSVSKKKIDLSFFGTEKVAILPPGRYLPRDRKEEYRWILLKKQGDIWAEKVCCGTIYVGPEYFPTF